MVIHTETMFNFFQKRTKNLGTKFKLKPFDFFKQYL